MARAADFSFDYVPRGRWDGWYSCEIYDGRVLLECLCPDSDLEVVLLDLAVCDPLSRRYLLLPPIPDGQAYEQNLKHYDVRFAPSVDEDDETSFLKSALTRTTSDHGDALRPRVSGDRLLFRVGLWQLECRCVNQLG